MVAENVLGGADGASRRVVFIGKCRVQRRSPLYLAPKLALYLATRERGMRNADLAKRLGVSETVVRRMLDPKHATKPERIQAALTALGKRIVVTFEDAA